MNPLDAAEEILTTMLGKLGFQVSMERSENADGPCLNLVSEKNDILIGKNGDRLEDLQYLLNRILCKHYPDAPRVRVDCENFRANQEAEMMKTAREQALQVREDGKSRRLKPLNAYYRRLVHNALQDIEGVKTSSPGGHSRYKRIQIEKLG
ncbi:MAG: protein jag [Akkermansiaceae bacterium]